MTQAANYSAQKLTVDSVDIVRLTDAAHAMEVSICPSVGNIAYDFTVNGKQILLPPYAKLSEWKAKPGQSGIPFLSRIPLLGLLFKQQNIRNNKRELLIFVTPKIIG